MPYIPNESRNRANEHLTRTGTNWTPQNAGELNFVVSTFIANYIRENGLRYSVLNEMVGALECAKMELSRVIVSPYEDVKIAENGPVYGGILPSDQY